MQRQITWALLIPTWALALIEFCYLKKLSLDINADRLKNKNKTHDYSAIFEQVANDALFNKDYIGQNLWGEKDCVLEYNSGRKQNR